MEHQTEFTKLYSEKWNMRFSFFTQNGAPCTKNNRRALKELPLFGRMKISMNWWAFFFGFIYFLILGLWRQALSLLGITILVSVIVEFVAPAMGLYITPSIATGINLGMMGMWAMTANYAYYLKEVRGIRGWNPFKGIF
ncbi:MAG: DUF2628 domain-containing protein [Kluyvera sp.]|uniref:DUF2628 domain-containing protein n=1 Tax=Kluyvera sp. TaxID=1538228 RepID=UPI003A88B3E7